jgi:uncharacterized damage-inducible protein DinB
MCALELENLPLKTIFEGWEGYQACLVQALTPLSTLQLTWQPTPRLRPVGEIAAHISLGRIDWFQRMGAPGSEQLAEEFAPWRSPGSVISRQGAPRAENAAEMVRWLEVSWFMVADTLERWTAADLLRTYRLELRGKVLAVSNQWTMWRVLTHDIHHGGEIALMLGLQGLPSSNLGDLGGHIVQPPLARE